MSWQCFLHTGVFHDFPVSKLTVRLLRIRIIKSSKAKKIEGFNLLNDRMLIHNELMNVLHQLPTRNFFAR